MVNLLNFTILHPDLKTPNTHKHENKTKQKTFFGIKKIPCCFVFSSVFSWQVIIGIFFSGNDARYESLLQNELSTGKSPRISNRLTVLGQRMGDEMFKNHWRKAVIVMVLLCEIFTC